MVLQSEGLNNVVTLRVPRRGLPETFKTNGFKKVLGLKVSGQGKVEFESDLSKMLIKQNKYCRLCKNIALAAASVGTFQKNNKTNRILMVLTRS